MSAVQVLQRVASIPIPPAALDHRFFTEAHANARLAASRGDDRNRVVGTGNTHQVELYGWGSSVGPHADNTGWMYFCPLLVTGKSTVHCACGDDVPLQVDVVAGDVVRLFDHCTHSTTDTGLVVAMFLGSFDRIRDDEAIESFRVAAARLAADSFYDAPRVRPGFRVMLDDECWAATPDHESYEAMLLADAKRQRRLVLLCGSCDRPAVRVDDHWPWHQEMNRCRRHFRRDA